MGWMRFVGVVFNLFGVVFLGMAALSIAFGTLFGGVDESATGTVIGGMMGMVGAVGSFIVAMFMFFFGSVLLGLRRLVAESIRTREVVAAAMTLPPAEHQNHPVLRGAVAQRPGNESVLPPPDRA